MKAKTPFGNLTVSVACGPVPCDTEEGRSFLQERLALYGKVGLLFSLGHFVFINALQVWSGEAKPIHCVSTWGNQLHLGICAVFLAVHLLCRRGARGHLALALIDLGGTFTVGLLLGLNACPEGFSHHSEWVGVLVLTNTILARAVFVPSSAAVTALISVLSTAPVLFGSARVLRQAVSVPGADFAVTSEGGRASTVLLLEQGAWCAVAVAVATLASRIIYGLQQEVREARQLGQYTLEEQIGAGGMGEVFRARHAMLRRPTAIKILRPDRAGERSLARFEREVQITSRLTHPNTIAIYDFGRNSDGLFYYAMEYLEGLDLDRLVERAGPQPPGRVIHILRQTCGSLNEAHGVGLIHRDIKPANMILCDRGGVRDVVKLVDFGLVKSTEPGLDVTVSGANTITGTPLYMSPESIRAPDSIDARSDLYSLGAVAYFLLTGTHLFESESFIEICTHHLHTEPEPPSRRLGRKLPGDLEQIVLSCLEKDPARRPANARRLAAALESCRDAGSWTQEVASRWWEENPEVALPPQPGSPQADASPPAPDSPLTRTAAEMVAGPPPPRSDTSVELPADDHRRPAL